jgi:hypothetical protein
MIGNDEAFNLHAGPGPFGIGICLFPSEWRSTPSVRMFAMFAHKSSAMKSVLTRRNFLLTFFTGWAMFH